MSTRLAFAPEAPTPPVEVPVGAILMWPTAVPPTGWLLLNGAGFDGGIYPELATVLGSTTLPDMRQRFPLGQAAAGTGSALLGTGGSIDHAHSQPSHTHTQPTHTHTGPSHTHTGPSHTHSIGSHTHPVNPPATASGGPSGPNTIGISLLGLGAAANTTHTHTVDIPEFNSGASTGNTGAEGTGNTGASGTGSTSASGGDDTGAAGGDNTGTANPPFLALNFIIRAE